MKRMKFYFDIVCPYAFLACERIYRLPKSIQARIDWHPMHLGGLLRLNRADTLPMNAMSAPRLKHNALDLGRWAERVHLPLSWPATHPMPTTNANRFVSTLSQAERPQMVRALFRAYWCSGSVSHWQRTEKEHRAFLLEEDTMESASKALFSTTQHVHALGAPGAPCFEVDGQLFWGQDRLFQALSMLMGESIAQDVGLESYEPTWADQPVSLYHDLASPFSYLAVTQIKRLSRVWRKEIELKPILLGGLFREIGTPDVPLFTFSEAKRAYAAQDLDRWAQYWDVEFAFPKNFPQRTVHPLRVLLLRPDLTESMYQWLWRDGKNLADLSILGGLLESIGESPNQLFAEASEPRIKQRLRNNTEEAEKLGLCGVPSFVVGAADDQKVVWGQDRICFLEWMLDGWKPKDESF